MRAEIDHLAALLKSRKTDSPTRQRAAIALRDYTGEKVAGALLAALFDRDKFVRFYAAQSLLIVCGEADAQSAERHPVAVATLHTDHRRSEAVATLKRLVIERVLKQE